MYLAKWLVIYSGYIVIVILLIPLAIATLWIYWWTFKFTQQEDVSDQEVEELLVEKLGGNPKAPIPQNRQIPIRFFMGGFCLGAWPIFLLGSLTFGLLGVALVAIFSPFVIWYFWERTIGFCKRVETFRRRIQLKG